MRNKGFAVLEVILAVSATVILSMITLMIYGTYSNAQKTEDTANNLLALQKFMEITQWQFNDLTPENIDIVPEGTFAKNAGDVYILPLKRRVETSALTYQDVFGEKLTIDRKEYNPDIGSVISIRGLSSKECAFLTKKVAPNFFETFIGRDSDDIKSVSNQVHLLPKNAMELGKLRHVVNIPQVTSMCSQLSKNIRVTFRHINAYDIKTYATSYDKEALDDLSKALRALEEKHGDEASSTEAYYQYTRIKKLSEKALLDHAVYVKALKLKEQHQKELDSTH